MTALPAVQTQGLGSVTADNLNAYSNVVQTFTQLRALSGQTGMGVIALGGAYVADGLQGVFYWVPTSTAADNGTNIIRPTGVANGAWVRLPLIQSTGLNQVVILPSGDTTGATDASAISVAIASGWNILLGAGRFYVNAGFSLNATANNGQMIRGCGAPDQSGNGAGVTIIQPTSAVTALFTLDGSSYGGYLQNVQMSDFSVDMANMPIHANGIYQLQAFDIAYSNIRFVNSSPASDQSGFYFGPGAYTTSVSNCQGGLFSIIGNGVNDPTTITFTNCDIVQFNATYTANVQFVGGAIQPIYYPTMTTTYLAANSQYTPIAVPNPSGIYLFIAGYMSNCEAITFVGTDFENGGGFPSTYNDGVHGSLNAVPVIQIGASTTRALFVNPLGAGIYFYDLGLNSSFQPANIGGGAGGNIWSTPSWFLTNLNVASSKAIYGYSDNGTGGTTQTFLIDASNGSASLQNLHVQPATNGANFDLVYDANGNQIFGFFAGGSLYTNAVFVGGAYFAGYSDNTGTTQTFKLVSRYGQFTFGTGTVGTPGQNYIYGDGTAGTVDTGNGYKVGNATILTNSALTLGVGGIIKINGTQVVGPQQTGWTAGTGTASKGAFASYAGQTIGAVYSQTQVQTLDNAARDVSQRLLAIEQALTAHGLINA